MKRAVLIVNPSSGGEKAKSYEDQVHEKLTTFFDEVVVRHTEKAGDATAFAREVCEAKCHSIFAMGGDGTVSEAISGIAHQKHRPVFGFIPLGTVNDLARALGISLEPNDAIEELDFERIRPIDIGEINDKYFMNVVAIGAIPEAINAVESKDKTQWGALAYFGSAFKQMMNMKYRRFLLEIDGEKREIQSSTILIGLTSSIGGFSNLLPNAEVDDGALHIIYLKDSNMLDSIMAVPNLLGGVEESTKNLGYLKFKKARIQVLDTDDTLTVNVDGDEGDPLPISVSVLPSHIQVYYGL